MSQHEPESQQHKAHITTVAGGTLYIVPTPIGNLADITQRAVSVLAGVDWVAAEDTRHSKRLFEHLGIQVRSLSLHQHNEAARTDLLTSKLLAGDSVALISDAGTPLISDPGYVLVEQCRERGIPVVALPGACAAITALSASGLATDKFHFVGFLPSKQQALDQAVKAIADSPCTSICYEAPRRVLATLKAMQCHLHDGQQVVLAKELTKTFERYVHGSPEQVIAWLKEDEKHQKGEFVLMIGAKPATQQDIPNDAIALLHSLAEILPPKKAAAVVAQHYQLKKNTLYALLLAEK